MVTKSLNVKFVAAFAVLAMMLAGVGAFFVAETNDAADEPTGDIKISFATGMPTADDESAFAPGVVKIMVKFKETNFSKITMLDYDTYNSMIKPFLTYESDGTATVPVAYFGVDDYDDKDPMFMKILRTLTAADVENPSDADLTNAKSGAIVFDMALEDAVKIDVESYDDAKVIATGIASAFATIPEGYKSPAEVAEAIKTAVADLSVYVYTEEDMTDAKADAKAEGVTETEAKYKGYVSSDDVQKAIDKAIADYKTANPIKADDTYLYMFIVALAIAIVLAAIMIFTRIIQPRLKASGKI